MGNVGRRGPWVVARCPATDRMPKRLTHYRTFLSFIVPFLQGQISLFIPLSKFTRPTVTQSSKTTFNVFIFIFLSRNMEKNNDDFRYELSMRIAITWFFDLGHYSLETAPSTTNFLWMSGCVHRLYSNFHAFHVFTMSILSQHFWAHVEFKKSCEHIPSGFSAYFRTPRRVQTGTRQAILHYFFPSARLTPHINILVLSRYRSLIDCCRYFLDHINRRQLYDPRPEPATNYCRSFHAAFVPPPFRPNALSMSLKSLLAVMQCALLICSIYPKTMGKSMCICLGPVEFDLFSWMGLRFNCRRIFHAWLAFLIFFCLFSWRFAFFKGYLSLRSHFLFFFSSLSNHFLIMEHPEFQQRYSLFHPALLSDFEASLYSFVPFRSLS